MRIRKLAGFITLAIFFASVFPIAALTAESVPRIAVAMSEDTPNTVDKVVYRAIRELGYDVEVYSYGMDSAIAAVNSDELDMLAFQVQTAVENYKNLVVVPECITTKEFRVYARSGNNGELNEWADFSGKNIGISYSAPYTESRLPDDVKQLSSFPTRSKMFEELQYGTIDYAIVSLIGDEEVAMPNGIRQIAVLDRQEAYTYVNKNEMWLVPLLTEQYKKMKQDGTMEDILSRNTVKQDGGLPDILYISSYSADMDIEKQFQDGFLNAISSNDYNLFAYNLESQRYFKNRQRNQSLINLIRSDFIDRNPDVIVVLGDDASEFVKQYYEQFFKGVPVIVCGVSDFAQSKYGEFADLFTGITQTISAHETVEVILKLFPQTKKLYVINSRQGSDIVWRNEIKRQLEPFKETLDIEFSPDVPMSRLLSELRALPSYTVVLNGVYYTDSDGNYYLQSESQKLFNSNISVPSFGLIGENIGYGQVGGKVIDTYNQGKYAGEALLELFRGTNVRDMPLVEESAGLNYWLFDSNHLKRWSISESSLPAYSEIINKKLTMMQSNPTEFVLLLLLIFIALVAIAALLNMTRELSEKNRQLHTTEELLAKDNEINELSKRSQRIISSAPLGFMLTKDDFITEINSYAEKHFGLQVGDRYFSAFADKEAHKKILDALNGFGYAQNTVNTLISANGDLKRFFTSGTTIDGKDGMSHANWAMDIEDLERKKDEIKLAQEDLEKVIFGLPSPVLLLDVETICIVYCNQCFINMFGFESIESAIGYSYYELFPETQPDGSVTRYVIDKSIETLVSSNSLYELERVFKLRDGSLIEAQASAGSIVYNERKTIILLTRDISTEKEQQRMLQNIAEKEKESNMMKSRFLMNMSHEIRTPMNAIIGLSELSLKRGCHDADAADTLTKINSSAKILLTIINDILDFSKIEAEKLDFINEEFEIEDVLSNAMLMSQQRLGDKTVEMLLNVSPEVPYRIIGDKTRVWQVLKNFLDNSAKFTNSGRIVCEVYLYQSESQIAWIGFTVTDTGIGMNADHLERVFLPFEQFGKSAQAKNAGTGLGMSIAKQLIELMGGTVEIQSTEGEGTKVDFILPFALPKQGLTFREMYERHILADIDVLLVDNDTVARGVMEELLDIIDVRYTSASSGEDALKLNEMAANRGEAFDIVILDYRMDGMDGIRTAQRLRPHLKEDVKILLVSAYSKHVTDDMLYSVGITDILAKPYSPAAFYNKIMSAMGMELNVKDASKKEKIIFPNARVLLCEDNFINQEVALGMLEEFNISAMVADNGRKALELLEKQEFDLVLMDIQMPEMDGHEATIYIRSSDKPYKNVPIVAMTANVMQEEIKRCMDEGMNGHISKPIDFQRLQSKLVKWLPGTLMQVEDTKDKPEDLPTVKGLDMDSGLAHFGGKKESYIAAVKLFLEHHCHEPMKFENAVAENNIKSLCSKLHNIIGVSATIGATDVYKAARDFDMQLRMNMPDILQYEKLNEYMYELRRSVVEMLGENE